MGAGAAGKAGANDDGAAVVGGGVTVGAARAKLADQHLSLAGKARLLADLEFSGGQRGAHRAGDRPGGQCRPGGRQASQAAAEVRRP